MIEETALVIRCDNNRAELQVERKSTCGTCQAKSGCGTAVLAGTVGKKVTHLDVANTLNLQVGDRVVVGLKENALLTGAFIVYLLPLVMMLFFASIGQWLASYYYQLTTELMVISFAGAGFVLAIYLVNVFSNRIKDDKRYQPVLIRKLII